MKKRLLVINGSKIVQTNITGEWQNQKVDKARNLKPGIYNIYSAQPADKSKKHFGIILHTDKEYVYQQSENGLVEHPTSTFDVLPEVGSNKTIAYSPDGKAMFDVVKKIWREKAF